MKEGLRPSNIMTNMAKHWKLVLFLSLLQAMTMCSFSDKIYDDPNYLFVRNATEAPPQSFKTYDYIIVGGGTTGCPLAATLSQNFSILLLERGGSPYGDSLVEDLEGFYPNLQIDTPTSTSQSFISEDGVPNQRARILGGGSAINAGFFTKPQHNFVKEVGWDPILVNSSFNWVADKVAQFPNLQVFQTAARDALLEAGVAPNNGMTYDHLIGTKIGGSLFDENGHRHSAADLLSYANPNNLDVFIWANVQNIIFNGSTLHPNVKAAGVLFKDLNGDNHTMFLNNERSEVILSAGAIGSPQLLMLSGIGPKDHLTKFNITTIYNNPFVGAHMADNPTNSLSMLTNKEVEVSLIEVVGITKFGSYIEIASGIAQALLEVAQETSKNVKKNSKLSKSPSNAQIMQAKILFAILSVPAKFRAQAVWSGNILHKIWGPHSWGYLKLTSSDVNETPQVQFNYFKDPRDLLICEKGIRIVLNTINATPLLSLQYTNESIPEYLRLVKDTVESTWPQRDFGNTTKDSINIQQWCKDSMQTIWHYHGGCLVGQVVNQDYQVKGMESLRVIDGSTFWRSPGTNPQATLMMLGRYMGVQILKERLGYKVNP